MHENDSQHKCKWRELLFQWNLPAWMRAINCCSFQSRRTLLPVCGQISFFASHHGWSTKRISDEFLVIKNVWVGWLSRDAVRNFRFLCVSNFWASENTFRLFLRVFGVWREKNEPCASPTLKNRQLGILYVSFTFCRPGVCCLFDAPLSLSPSSINEMKWRKVDPFFFVFFGWNHHSRCFLFALLGNRGVYELNDRQVSRFSEIDMHSLWESWQRTMW